MVNSGASFGSGQLDSRSPSSYTYFPQGPLSEPPKGKQLALLTRPSPPVTCLGKLGVASVKKKVLFRIFPR